MSDIPVTPCTPPRSKPLGITAATPPASSKVFSQFKTPQSHSKHHSKKTLNNTAFLQPPPQREPHHFHVTPQKGSSQGLTVPLMTPEKTPMKSPRRHKSASKDHISMDLSPMRLFTKKSSTVGSGRYLSLQKLFSIFDLQDAQNMSLMLDSDNEQEDQDSPSHSPQIPLTPSKKIITDAVVERWHNEHLAQIAEEVDAEDDMETEIYRDHLPNPFVEKKTITIINPFSKKPVKMANPFNTSSNNNSIKNRSRNPPLQEIDYSTHMELINPKTGARIIRELSENEKRIKPKKLDFSHLVDEDNESEFVDDDAPTDLDTPDTFNHAAPGPIHYKRRRMDFEVYEE